MYCASRLISRRNDQAIAVDPSSPWGYQAKHAALHGAGRYDDAIKMFETMLSKMEQSPDRQIRGELYPRYGFKSKLLTRSNRASRSIRQPIGYASTDSQSGATDYPTFATRTHKHDHWSPPEQDRTGSRIHVTANRQQARVLDDDTHGSWSHQA